MTTVRSSVKFERRDRGMARIRRVAARMRIIPPFVAVGIQGSEARREHSEGLTIAEIGAIHEFSLHPDLPDPPRSMIQGTLDDKRNEMKRLTGAAARSVVRGKRSTRQALGIVGAKTVGMIQSRIAAGIPPALKPATIARKGSSTPLIDTGQLRGSFSWEVFGG